MKKVKILLCIMVCVACKTRKVQTDITETSKLTNTDQISHVQSSDNVEMVDRFSQRSTSLKTAENTAEGEIDSIVTIGKKTVVYPTKGKPFKLSGNTSDIKYKTKQNDIKITGSKSLDSAGTFKQTTKQDSSHKAKIVDAKGSGTTWATWIPITGGLVLAFGLFLVYRYFKK